MIILVGKWKQKVLRIVTALVLLLAFVALVPVVSGLLYEKVPVFNGWFEDEKPSGNPMRVQSVPQDKNWNEQMDRFVLEVQNFYYDEKIKE
ncbi:MAG TPA: hypothetical protein GX404_09755 [Syntrophomonadaceae bacterium]|nr:hypothetical protein [Syntrophomonadaceae bacterium]